MSTIDSANPSQEYPGHRRRPTNESVGGEFQTAHSSVSSFSGADMASLDHWYGSGNNLGRVVALSCAQSRIFLSGPYAGLVALIPLFYNLSAAVSRRPRSVAREPRESSVKWGWPAHGPRGNGARARRLHGNFRAALRRGGLSIRISPLAKLGARSRPRRLPLHQPRQCADPRFLD